ncbi:MAG: mechanosensitive ion channel family protein [Thermoplasmata archaeon]|jgi:small-conductance mechanosensitive channel
MSKKGNVDRKSGLISLIVSISITVFLVLISIYLLHQLKLIPIEFEKLVYAIIILIGGIVLTLLISKFINNRMSPIIGKNTANSLTFIVQLLGYIISTIIFFSYIGVGFNEALAAGGFTGLILGLASQTVLSNIFGGINILISKPFKIGDRITLATWQYDLIFPTYPPKFWSNDFLIPGFTGEVVNISLLYTSIITDEKIFLKIPNNVVVQAAVILHGASDARVVRTKYEVPKTLDPDIVIPAIKKALEGKEFLRGSPEIRILDTTFTTYILVIEALCEGVYEEPPRSEIIKITMKVVNNLLDSQKKVT